MWAEPPLDSLHSLQPLHGNRQTLFFTPFWISHIVHHAGRRHSCMQIPLIKENQKMAARESLSACADVFYYGHTGCVRLAIVRSKVVDPAIKLRGLSLPQYTAGTIFITLPLLWNCQAEVLFRVMARQNPTLLLVVNGIVKCWMRDTFKQVFYFYRVWHGCESLSF